MSVVTFVPNRARAVAFTSTSTHRPVAVSKKIESGVTRGGRRSKAHECAVSQNQPAIASLAAAIAAV